MKLARIKNILWERWWWKRSIKKQTKELNKLSKDVVTIKSVMPTRGQDFLVGNMIFTGTEVKNRGRIAAKVKYPEQLLK